MSEHLPNHEHHKHHEKLVDPEHHKQLEKDIHDKAERARQELERSAENLKLLHELAKKEAETQNKPLLETEEIEPDSLLGMQHSLKSNAYERTLLNVQQKLPKPARIFSKITHNKTVDAISSASAKTVARPSGLLGGSIFAFIGSLLLLYFSKHYGFTYNYALFLILFVVGFTVGAIIELGLWAWHRNRHGKY